MYTTEVRPVTHKIARRFTHHFEKEATVFLTAARRYVFITCDVHGRRLHKGLYRDDMEEIWFYNYFHYSSFFKCEYEHQNSFNTRNQNVPAEALQH